MKVSFFLAPEGRENQHGLRWSFRTHSSFGLTSSRVIAHKTCTDVVYMYLAGMLEPDFRTIADF